MDDIVELRSLDVRPPHTPAIVKPSSASSSAVRCRQALSAGHLEHNLTAARWEAGSDEKNSSVR